MQLPWFRRHKDDPAPPHTSASEASEREPLTVDVPPGPERGGEDGQSTTATARRRRGSRGGRNRKKKAAGTASTVTAPPPAESRAEQPEPKRSGQSRRRSAPKRAPLPKAKRELLVSVDAGEKRVAVLEDDRVAEVYLERPERRSIAANVYLGIVDNVLPGMEAAFVEIGLEKNGFLYVDEIVGPELEGRKGARKIQDLIQRGETILVQAVKDPMKTKGARLTTEISLPGRFVVYVPHGEGVGVSRRIEDDERNRLKAIIKELAPKHGGVIVRTAAEGASAEDIERDLDVLQRLWKSIQAQAKGAKAPSLIYQEAELPLRVVRDLFTGDFERLLVDHDRTFKRIVGYLKKTSPHMVERVSRYREREPLLEAFGVEQEIRSTLNRRVDLPSGGYLIFDYAEAFTVIDVNTGRFVGSRSKRSAGRLEDTITKNNLEAVKEVVRQLRLRDIGGIIVIDFIDMASPKNRAAVEKALGEELERDRTKTYVVEISPLGLVEMTRQNVTDGPREVMTKKCPTCGGDGIVISEQTAAVDIERRLRGLVMPGSREKAFRVEVAAPVQWLIAGPGGSRLRELEETTKRRFFLVGREGEHLDHFRVLERGSLEKVAPTLPVEPGQEVQLTLGELGLYDPRAGVGKLDGVDVVVARAAKLVGKKVKARIAAVSEGVVWAELVSPAEDVRTPLTAEAEAEKPTRARRSAAKVETEEPGEDGVVEDGVAEGSVVEGSVVEGSVVEGSVVEGSVVEGSVEEPGEAADETAGAGEGAADGGEPAPKKRTRRGSRGGRNRRKKSAAANGVAATDEEPADAAETEPETEPEPEPEAAADGGPVIHLPDRDLGDRPAGEGEQPPRKRTRRGSRGGRNRHKKTGAAAVADGAEPAEPEEAAAVEPEPVEPAVGVAEPSANGRVENDDAPGDERPWEYTPMSEWDFE